jgi:hypothetical protein
VAFAFNKTNGYVTVGGGTYRVRVVANATTASADSTVAIKAVYNVNGGTFSDVPMTEIKQELSVLAANAVRIESNGYITVGSGDTSLIKMQIKRESGTGTPTLAANQHFIEVTRIDA